MALTPGGTIRIDAATLATSAPGVFAGGDVAFGPRNLIEAVANGKRAAQSIHAYLSRGTASIERHLDIEKIPTSRYRMIAGFERFDRKAPPTLDLGRRTGITEVETGYGDADAIEQAARCLVCHVQTIYDPELCVLCNRCVDICPEHCLAIVPFDSLDLDGRDARRAGGARAGVEPAPLGHGERRRAVHPVRAVRDPLSDRRDDDGEVHDHGTPRAVPCATARCRCANAGGNDMSDANEPQNTDRRDFLLKLGAGAGFVAITAQAGASLRSLVPNVTYDAPTTVKLGPPEEFPDGLKFLPDERLFVFRNGKTFHAISAVCTHLGCTVRAEALARPEEQTIEGQPLRLTHRFMCPCHGSTYRGDGSNVSGPAPTPLAWYRLAVSPDDGQLVVDLADEVDHAFRLTLS